MDQLRLAVVAFVATSTVAGCGRSEAGPTSGLTPPAGWRPLPAIADAAADAATRAKVPVAGSEAWGEPARGCYAVWLGASKGAGTGTPAAVAELLVRDLTSEPMLAGLTVANVTLPAAGADSGLLSLSFTRPPYQGLLRTLLARNGSFSALACFWNLREPAACAAACATFVGGMR